MKATYQLDGYLAKRPPTALHLTFKCRFLAEVPDAFAQRVQKLLPLLMTANGGEGVPFLLPTLLQALDMESSSDAEGQTGWVTALLQNEVCMWPLDVLLRLLIMVSAAIYKRGAMPPKTGMLLYAG